MTIIANAKRPIYPFGAIVGQEQTKWALLLNAISPSVGGVLIQGEKGNAKSTAVRALAELLPPVPVVPGCPSLCDPASPFEFCPVCKGRPWDGEPGYAPAPFVEMPVSAGEDRLVGHMDVEAAMAEGRFSFHPGLLAKAHRGILYVDEINLLPDHLVDMLLDAAASGWNRVERDGFSVSHPAKFILVGTMNPEEGELRPQLLDRFGLCVEVSSPTNIAERAEIMSRRIRFNADPLAFAAEWEDEMQAERERLRRARDAFANVTLPYARLEQVARICLEAKTEGMRADLVICETAKAIAAYRQRAEVTAADVNDAAPLALRHRSSEPWQPDPEPDPGPDNGGGRQDGSDPGPQDGDGRQNGPDPGPGDGDGRQSDPEAGAGTRNADGHGNGNAGQAPPGSGGSAPSRPPSPSPPPTAEAEDAGAAPPHDGSAPPLGPLSERLLPIDSAFRLDASLLRSEAERAASVKPRAAFGVRKGGVLLPPNAPGRHLRSRKLAAGGGLACQRIDWPRTIQAAAVRRARRDSPPGPVVARADLHEKVIAGTLRQVLLIALDASGSMASFQRMKQTKAAVLSLIEQAYRDRHLFALLCFRHRQAELLCPPTRSVGLARQALEQLTVGGGTPLAAGLKACRELLERWRTARPELQPHIYLVTDGRVRPAARAAHPDSSFEAAIAAARALAEQPCRITVVDTEIGTVRLGLARRLAGVMQASRCVALHDLAK